MTDLAKRMSLHVAGQVTWPEPDIGRNCTQCRFYAPIPGHNPTDKGKCAQVRNHQKVDGKNFKGADAIACPQFQEHQRKET